MTAPETHELRLKRLRYRASYRGMQELDIVFRSFMDVQLKGLSNDELHLLETLMECNERDLMSWLFGFADVPQEHNHQIFHALKNYVPN